MTAHFKKLIVGAIVASAVLSAGSAFAQITPITLTAPAGTMTRKTIDLPCAAAAVATREAAVSAAFETKAAAIEVAFTKRASDLAAAWAITTAKTRNAAIKTAWKTFNASAKTARTAYMTANKAAWKTFATDAKACRATPVETSGSSTDASL
jgi:hypothetical protein